MDADFTRQLPFQKVPLSWCMISDESPPILGRTLKMILPVPATSTLNWPFSFSFTRTTIMRQGIQNRNQGRHKARQERLAQTRQHHPSHASGWFVSTTHFLHKYVVGMELFLDRIRNSCFKMVGVKLLRIEYCSVPDRHVFLECCKSQKKKKKSHNLGTQGTMCQAYWLSFS